METIQVNTSQHVAIDYPVAGLGERVAARLIDLGAFIVVGGLLMLLTMLGISVQSNILIISIWSIFGACYVFYNLITEIFMNGQSIGKRLLKIKVISLNGGQPSIGQYFIRWVFRLVDFSLTAQVGGLICVAATEKKQRIGDIVAGTTLIKTVPRTDFNHIAFHPVEDAYTPVFAYVDQLTDRDAELIHEVISTFHKTNNADLIYTMSERISTHLAITIPAGMNELDFLKTVIKDYRYITSRTD
ncbi:RDD family protein [Pedobacter foliorum]|uniref:RDD family protein n=1 Tax=Pedobacter foliorum TaxID=2739058 RepID=UPI001565DCBA|nr:RDD family protein [Pedobacter foliorum]NRF38726.1 RDD family protein [Pedobacter foliorum]